MMASARVESDHETVQHHSEVIAYLHSCYTATVTPCFTEDDSWDRYCNVCDEKIDEACRAGHKHGLCTWYQAETTRALQTLEDSTMTDETDSWDDADDHHLESEGGSTSESKVMMVVMLETMIAELEEVRQSLRTTT